MKRVVALQAGAAALAISASAGLLLAACDRRTPERPETSREYAQEVDEVHERHQTLHEKGQELDRRLRRLEQEVALLRAELGPRSAEWAVEALGEVDSTLETARREIADFRAATGPDWEILAREAEDAMQSLRDSIADAREQLSQNRSAGPAADEPGD